MRSRTVAYALILAAGIGLLAGCTAKVQEPWVTSADQLRQERNRPAAQMKELHERLMMVQTDR